MPKPFDLPPIYTLLCVLAAALLAWLLPVWRFDLALVGPLAIALGFVLIVWAGLWFRRKATTIVPRQAPQALIVEGPFKISRNPMYLAMVCIVWGAGLWLGALSALVPAIWLAWFLNKNFIRPEERKLREALGPSAEVYFTQTGRWLWFWR